MKQGTYESKKMKNMQCISLNVSISLSSRVFGMECLSLLPLAREETCFDSDLGSPRAILPKSYIFIDFIACIFQNIVCATRIIPRFPSSIFTALDHQELYSSLVLTDCALSHLLIYN